MMFKVISVHRAYDRSTKYVGLLFFKALVPLNPLRMRLSFKPVGWLALLIKAHNYTYTSLDLRYL